MSPYWKQMQAKRSAAAGAMRRLKEKDASFPDPLPDKTITY
jgi:hypothetical protein